MDQQRWSFGGADAVSGEEHLFGGEGKRDPWMTSEFGFETQGITILTYHQIKVV